MRKDRMKVSTRRQMYDGRRPVATVTLDDETVLQMQCWERAYGEIFGRKVTHDALISYWMERIGRVDGGKGKTMRTAATMDSDVAKIARRYWKETQQELKTQGGASEHRRRAVETYAKANGLSMSEASSILKDKDAEKARKEKDEVAAMCGHAMDPIERRAVLDVLDAMKQGVTDSNAVPGELVGVWIGGRGRTYIYRVYVGHNNHLIIYKKKGRGCEVVKVSPSAVWPYDEILMGKWFVNIEELNAAKEKQRKAKELLAECGFDLY